MNWITFYQGITVGFLSKNAYYNELGKTILSGVFFFMLQFYRMYSAKILSSKVTELWLSKDLSSIHLRLIGTEKTEKVLIKDIMNNNDSPKQPIYLKTGIYYPISFKVEKQARNKKTEAQLEMLKEEFVKKYGESAKKRIEEDTLRRQSAVRLLFCRKHTLINYLDPQTPQKPFIEFENVQFHEGTVFH